MMEELCTTLGAAAVSARFVYLFLEKVHTRHIGPAKFNNTHSHRHSSNKRSKRRGVAVIDFDTQEITKLKKAPSTVEQPFFGTGPAKFDKDATLIIER